MSDSETREVVLERLRASLASAREAKRMWDETPMPPFRYEDERVTIRYWRRVWEMNVRELEEELEAFGGGQG